MSEAPREHLDGSTVETQLSSSTAQETKGLVEGVLEQELSPIALKRYNALRKYGKKNPKLLDAVIIDNQGITINLGDEGIMDIGLIFDTERRSFKQCNPQYSEIHYRELIKLFGEYGAPYIDILGLKFRSVYLSSTRCTSYSVSALLICVEGDVSITEVHDESPYHCLPSRTN